MSSKPKNEFAQAAEWFLESSRALSNEARQDTQSLMERIKKLHEENDVEVDRITAVVNKLRREVFIMLEQSRDFGSKEEDRYFFSIKEGRSAGRLIDAYRKPFDPPFLMTILIGVVVFVVLSYFFCANFFIQRAGQRVIVTLVLYGFGGFLALVYVAQAFRIWLSLAKYRDLHRQRLELGRAFYTIENSLHTLEHLQSEMTSTDNESALHKWSESARVLWRHYDGLIVDFLYKKRKSV
jgi:hypothetical protein